MAQAKTKHRPPNQPNNKVLGIGTDISKITIKGSERPLLAVIGGAVTDATITRTIGGASNIQLVIHDPERDLLNNKLLEEKWDLHLDGLDFRYKGVQKDGPDLTLKFIERNAARLQEVKGARKAYRDQVTRAEFILSEVREAEGEKIPVQIFELHKRQPIKHKSDRQLRKEQRNESGEEHTQGEPGLGKADVGHIKVKHVDATLAQIHIIDEVLDVGMSMGATFKLLVASIMTITQESAVSILNSSTGYGPFSQLRNGAWPATGDPSADARGFFQVGMKIDKANPSQSKTHLAQAIQKSAYPQAYATWEDEATETVERYLGGTDTGSVEQTVTERYPFERTKKENAWTNTRKLASEVKWRRFMVAGKFFYVPDTYLMRAQRRAVLDEEDSGVDSIDFEMHENVKIQEATVLCRAQYWAVPPGCICELSEAMGPAAGNYLVQSIESSLFNSDPNLTVKIHRPVEPLKEPENETHTRSLSIPGGGITTDLSGIDIPKDARGSGAPNWGGTRRIFYQFVTPYMEGKGLSPGSEKEEGHAEGSDHALTSAQAYAVDYPTTDGEKIARELAHLMGDSNWKANSYTPFKITVDGLDFQVQILWGAAIEHADHVHVGMHRA